MKTKPKTVPVSEILRDMAAAVAAFLLLAFVVLASSCTHVDRAKLQDWATMKAQRWAECQLRDPASREQAEACLGEFVQDLGTESCEQVSHDLDALETDTED